MLSAESGSLGSSAFRDLANAVLTTSTDLAVPCYDCRRTPAWSTPPSSIRLPRTLRLPCAVSLGRRSRPFASHGRTPRSRRPPFQRGPTRVEAASWRSTRPTVAGLTIDQFDVGPRVQPPPTIPDPQHHSSLGSPGFVRLISTPRQHSAEVPPVAARGNPMPCPGHAAGALHRCGRGDCPYAPPGFSARLHQPP